MDQEILSRYLKVLEQRALDDGGFWSRPGGQYRPDATAWAILALDSAGHSPDLVREGRSRLAKGQMEDGRVPLSPFTLDAFWPTSLALLAWHGSGVHLEQTRRGGNFLLNTTGIHFEKTSEVPVGHDPYILGWPWVGNTHSWVEPTSLCMIALQVAGYGEHGRVKEATKMLMDRVLSGGGWNTGNTVVFSQETRPAPEFTGMALNALTGRVPRDMVQPGLDYLRLQVERVRTPLSLGWALLGLGAWGIRPKESDAWIRETLYRQKEWGDYDTDLLSILLIALQAKGGLLSVMP